MVHHVMNVRENGIFVEIYLSKKSPLLLERKLDNRKNCWCRCKIVYLTASRLKIMMYDKFDKSIGVIQGNRFSGESPQF